MTTIQPPKMLNSFRENPIDKTGLQSPVIKPRANQHMQEQVQAAITKPAAKPADQVTLSAQIKQVTAKPAVVKAESKPAAPLATPPTQTASSPTEAAKGKSINLLA
jgi:hypothetical protein